MEMEEVVCNDLPEEILLMIMARLPTRKCLARMKTVCKGWKELVSFHGRSCCSPCSFLFQFPRLGGDKVDSWVMEASGEFYKVPFVKFSAYSYYIDLACNHMYCLSTNIIFSICNESDRGWKRLPISNMTSTRRTFIGCGFDPSSQQCIIVMSDGMKLERYNSQSNLWSEIDATGDYPVYPGSRRFYWSDDDSVYPSGKGVYDPVYPSGKGVYSHGRFYWLNTSDNNSTSNGQVAELNLSESRWTIIPPPPETAERDYSLRDSDSEDFDDELYNIYYSALIRWNSSTLYWELAGSEGQVVLVDKKWGCMWKLERENTWSRLDINLPKEIYQVSVHSSGWTLVVAQEILLYDENKILVRKIGLEELDSQLRKHLKKSKQIYNYKDGSIPSFLSPFECTNLWWPWRH